MIPFVPGAGEREGLRLCVGDVVDGLADFEAILDGVDSVISGAWLGSLILLSSILSALGSMAPRVRPAVFQCQRRRWYQFRRPMSYYVSPMTNHTSWSPLVMIPSARRPSEERPRLLLSITGQTWFVGSNLERPPHETLRIARRLKLWRKRRDDLMRRIPLVDFGLRALVKVVVVLVLYAAREKG